MYLMTGDTDAPSTEDLEKEDPANETDGDNDDAADEPDPESAE